MARVNAAMRSWLMVAVACVALCAPAWAAQPEKQDTQPVASPAAKPAVPAPVATVSPQEKLREQVRAKLNGTNWTLELKPETGGKTVQDTVTFEGRTVKSSWLTKSGYNVSNYSLQVSEDGSAVWETMQSKEGEGLAFWRGELAGEKMSGVLSKQPKEGTPMSYNFSATKVASAAPATPAAPAVKAAPPAATTPKAKPSAPAPAPTTNKKRRR